MRSMRILTTLLALLTATIAAAGDLTAGLGSYLAQKRGDEAVRALLVLSDQVDVPALDLDLHLRRADLATRHFQVVTALQEKALATQGALLTDLDARLGRDIDAFQPYWLINAVLVTGSEDAIRELAARRDVVVAELDLVIQLIEPTIAAGKNGTRGIGITDGLVSVGARRVWDELGIRGEGALVGSFDTGVDGNHPALSARWRGNHAPAQECWLDVLGTGTQFPTDNNAHGTHTTGTMLGLALDDTIGVAPAAEWIAVNCIDQGVGPALDSDVLACLQFFADPDGDPGTLDDVPDVVQNSWGVNENFVGYYDCDSRWWAAVDACEAAGVLLCWSAGNEGPGAQSVRSPADRATTLYNCFSVGSTATTAPFPIAASSSRGPAGPDCGPVENRAKPEIVAPGINVYSSVPGGGYQYYSGTSMAGPHVAGVAALMRSANPDVDVITIKQILMATADDLGPVGEDNSYGHGFLDAFEAVQAVMGGLGWVEGVVRDAGTGLPLDGATVSVADSYQTAVTGADGFYRFTLPEGPATVVATAFGYVDVSVPVTVVDGATLTQDLMLTAAPMASLTGVVHRAGHLPPDAAPADGAVVRIAGVPLDAVTTGTDGRFEFQLPAGGVYQIQATLSGQGAIGQTIALPGDLTVDLYLSPLTTEGFETGDFSAMPWVTDGNAEWSVQSSDAYEGAYAARSGDIGNVAQSSLQVSVDCGAGGQMSFFYRVSSEEDYDFLRFSIDGALDAEWSGNSGWLPHAVNVSPGEHTFRWIYTKDQYVSYLHDAAWIDAIVFPGGSASVPVAVAAPWILDFGRIATDSQADLPLLVMNQGQQPLDVTVSGAAAHVTVTNGVATIEAYGHQLAQATVDAAGLPVGHHSTWVHVDSNDPANPRLLVEVVFEVTDGMSPVDDAPRALAVHGAVPNPFNPATTIRYTTPAAGHVSLRLYDVQGRLVRDLLSEVRPGGLQEVRWDGRDQSGRAAASGTYFARLQYGGQRRVKGLVLVR